MPKRRPLLLAVLLGLFLGASAEAREDAKTLVERLGGSDWRARNAAYQELVARKDDRALPHLRRLVPTFGDSGQYYGVLVLERYPFRKGRRAWRDFAECASPYLRFCGAQILTRHDDEDMAVVASEALRTPSVSPTVRLWMIRRIVTRDDPRILAAQRTLLRPGQDLAVLVQLLTTYHRFQDRRAVPQATALLRDGRAGVRAMGAAFLYDLGQTARAADLASAILAGMGQREITFVARVLSANRRVTDDIHDALATRLGTETNPTLILQWIDLVGQIRSGRARPVLRKLVHHANDQVARRAFDVLVSMHGPVREDTLRPLLRGEDIDRRLWAADALRRRDDFTGIGGVVYALNAGTVSQRKTAATMLRGFVMDMAVEPLLDALGDEHADVRGAALGSLQVVLSGLFPFRTLDVTTTGYDPNDEAATRTAAVARLRAWWRTNRTADW